MYDDNDDFDEPGYNLDDEDDFSESDYDLDDDSEADDVLDQISDDDVYLAASLDSDVDKSLGNLAGGSYGHSIDLDKLTDEQRDLYDSEYYGNMDNDL